MDSVVHALTQRHIYVILDNHVSNSNWCCSDTDGNGLWWNSDYSAEGWMTTWLDVTKRYIENENVVGADLRNELRSANISGTEYDPTWGDGDVQTDWKLAATK
jgi:endoglucanase